MRINDKAIRKNNLSALINVVLLMVGFVAVCAAVLALVFALGVVPVPDFLKSDKTEPPAETTFEPIYNLGELLSPEPDSGSSLSGHEVTPEAVLNAIEGAPFIEEYTLQAEVKFLSDNAEHTDFVVLWYSGGRYRIHIVNSGKLIRRIICDGESVCITAVETGSTRIFPASDKLSVGEISGLPYFDRLFTDSDYKITEVSESDGIYTVTCGYENSDMRDVYNVTTSTGIIVSSKSFVGDICVFTSDTIYFSRDIDENEDMFALPSGSDEK